MTEKRRSELINEECVKFGFDDLDKLHYKLDNILDALDFISFWSVFSLIGISIVIGVMLAQFIDIFIK